MPLSREIRLWVGSRLMIYATKVATRIIGKEELDPARFAEDEDEDDVPAQPVYPPVKITEEARAMIYQSKPRVAPKPEPPLKGSLADRLMKAKR